jgi:hypothetical protein
MFSEKKYLCEDRTSLFFDPGRCKVSGIFFVSIFVNCELCTSPKAPGLDTFFLFFPKQKCRSVASGPKRHLMRCDSTSYLATLLIFKSVAKG